LALIIEKTECWKADEFKDPAPVDRPDQKIVEKYGDPIRLNDNGGVVNLNQRYFAGSYFETGNILFEPDENSFFEYDPTQGLWKRATDARIREKLAARIQEYGKSSDVSLVHKINASS